MKKIALLILLSIFLAACRQVQNPPGQTGSGKTSQEPSEEQTVSFGNPKKSAHYVSNTPEHGSTQAVVPEEIVINFNFDLTGNSTISVKSDSKEYGSGKVIFDSNQRTMRVALDQSAPDGVYTVSYNACWPDGSCHDGNFQFAIDRP